ncbi:hypothetical protein BDQ17DRAFT_1346431 [Cyathus striatus]|nr:hypothetical protein BDQ17DRAFT_1346431 [Cyathus striatus]
MAEKGGAYSSKAADTDFRKKWDKEEYAERAKQKDQEERERMQENEERMKQGGCSKAHRMMKAREAPLELDKNLGKTMRAGQPGFFCETCTRTFKDSVGYLDHINSRAHLRLLGQTTKVERSTVEQVRLKIASLREQTKNATTAKTYDFEKRLAEVKAKEQALRDQKKAEKKAEKEKARLDMIQSTGEGDDEMANLWGLAASGRRRNKIYYM